MIVQRVYTVHEEYSKNLPALINAVSTIRGQYPAVSNNNSHDFDRLFEKINPGCRIIQGPPCFVEWDNDEDYTWFILKWA